MADYRLIGTNQTPKDLRAKITGRAMYAEDYRAEGMAFGKLLLSPVPHGRVVRLDASRASPTWAPISTACRRPAATPRSQP